MDLKKIDLPTLVESASSEFKGKRPTEEELRRFVALAGFGVGEAIALAALLFSIWSYYNPRTSKTTPVCQSMFKGQKCGLEFIESEKDEEFIRLWCIRKHQTTLRIK
jgi:hypothetical protein